jgi:hypothetical protein
VESLPSERRILKKEEQGLKRKRGKTSFKKLHVSKKREEMMRFTIC